MTDLNPGRSPRILELSLDSTRFARVARFLEDPRAERALLAFGAAIPWARDPRDPGVRADDDLYIRSIADWTELILRAYESGCTYYAIATSLDVTSFENRSPSWFALDELIRCNRPEGVVYRTLLQEATTLTDRTGEAAPFEKTGWYDDGRVQAWAFVFWRAASSAASPDPTSVDHS